MPANTVAHAGEVTIFNILQKTFFGTDAVPCDLFAVPFASVMFYGDGNFDELALHFCKIGIKSLFADECFPVLLDADAVIDFFGKHVASEVNGNKENYCV